jgi:uncharacterized membrane protein
MTGQLSAAALVCCLGISTMYNGQPIGSPFRGDGFTIASEPYTFIRPGETRTIEITIERDADFDRVLNLQVAAPNGLKASLATRRLTPSKGKTVDLTVTAEKDAPRGKRVITVAAFAATGQPTTTGVHLFVEDN